MLRSFRIGFLPALAGVLATWAYSTPAEACGGTFCDAGPTVMPVDQTGENILFVLDGDTVEAHVQIQYTGDPEQFAWVVPVMAEPEIETGSDPLFDALLAATVPTFTLDNRIECDDPMGGPPIACGFSPESVADAGASAGLAGVDDQGEPDVLDVGVAGAFEYAVLSGGTVDGVVTWLDDNGFAQDPEAGDILAQYLAEGFLFVAFKLRSGTDTDEIHPVVIRYRGTEPCVPIRLTRIAAKDDMGIRAFFLGEHRAAPTNYRSVVINPFAVDWVNFGINYDEVVTRAADGPGADGHAFVTEYAGTSTVVTSEGIANPRWDSSKFIDIEATAVVDELAIQALVNCSGGQCMFMHPLIEALLDKYLPRPAGFTPEDFYGCLECYEEEIDAEAWDGPAFAAELEERIVGPAEHAVDLLLSNPYLTRLYTTMSPHEMTEDPLFHVNEDLPDVSNMISATLVSTCEGPDYVELPDGRRLAVDDSGMLPDMPAAVAVEEVPPAGAPMVVTDEEGEIEGTRSSWNASHGLGEEGCNCRQSRRNFGGAAWMAFVLGFAGLARRRRTRC
jgi:hypothetical protein